MNKNSANSSVYRRYLIQAVLLASILVLFLQALDMQVLHNEFLQRQGDARHLREIEISAHRGDIYDRNGEPLAVSTPVDSVWMNPQEVPENDSRVRTIASLLGVSYGRLEEKLRNNRSRQFIYVKRHVAPSLAKKVQDLGLPGVDLQREYRRYYPTGEISAHVIGLSNVDDRGQEGLELAFDDWLKGTPGRKQIIRDRLGRAVNNIGKINPAQPGKSITLSIDKRLQYLTYRSLKAAVKEHRAVAGSAVVLDVHSGEILAMANQPSFNVNDRSKLRVSATRNRAVTDVFEPGSTMKPLTVAAALESGRWKHYYKVETAPGYMRVQGNLIRDMKNYGDLDVGGVIFKSSNVGISKIVQHMELEQQMDMYQQLGLGVETGSGFPGESSGRLTWPGANSEFERAALAFGYGVSVTPLQLSRAYAAIAANGLMPQVTFMKRNDDDEVERTRVMTEETAGHVIKMMEKVVSAKGTGHRAHIPNYRVAGKTGTVHKFAAGGYAEDRYLSIFAGMAPASEPRLVMVVVIDEPGNGAHFGGEVAAPVFSRVMSGAMRLLDITPDDVRSKRMARNVNGDGSA